mmetsp:Transcript_1858/g.4995  ORF Transcript_1858/g.4995 Transcript_1858/m.4995 type:complete len:214 (-) Transcript_1858:173-814(-)
MRCDEVRLPRWMSKDIGRDRRPGLNEINALAAIHRSPLRFIRNSTRVFPPPPPAPLPLDPRLIYPVCRNVPGCLGAAGRTSLTAKLDRRQRSVGIFWRSRGTRETHVRGRLCAGPAELNIPPDAVEKDSRVASPGRVSPSSSLTLARHLPLVVVGVGCKRAKGSILKTPFALVEKPRTPASGRRYLGAGKTQKILAARASWALPDATNDRSTR